MPGLLTLVTEDLPSEAICERLVSFADPELIVNNKLGKKGIGYIKSKLRSLNEAAAGMKILVVVDRDAPGNCPIRLTNEWIGGARNPNLVVRFAEMETESWVMADRERFAEFFEVPENRVPDRVDNILDAKQALVNTVRSSRSSRIREEICPAQGASSLVGPAYNSRLETFIRDRWRPRQAIRFSPSLRRAEKRIRELGLRS